MNQAYSNSQRLAITAGTAATAGAIGLLLSEPLTTGRWTADHAITPLVVALTIAAGHLVGNAVRDRKALAAFGFTVAFLIGTAITVVGGVGRQAEGAQTKTAEAEKTNAAISSKQAELTKARLRYEQAQAQAEKEMTGSTCGNRCKDWKTRASEVDSHVRILEAELSRLGAVKPVNAKAEQVAELAAVFGADATKVKAAVTTIEPVAVPFLLEWTAIVAIGFGFGHRRQPPPLPATEQLANARETRATVGKLADGRLPPKPGKGRRTRTAGRKRDPKVISFVQAFRDKHGRAPTGKDIKAEFPGMPTSTAYDAAKVA